MGEVRQGASAQPLPGSGGHPDYLPPGTEVNGFRLVRHVDSGGYGSVWRAESVHDPGKHYALKFSLRADERAEREVRLMLQVAHPNVVRVVAHGRWPDPRLGWRYLVMEWVEGSTLLEWARQHNPPLRVAVRLIQKVARALQATHAAAVVHRDVKPANVLVREADGEPFLGDFGAGDAAGGPTLTQPGLPPGTPAYRSPEAWAFARRGGTVPYTFQPADDWYALGVTLYVLLTQVPPFPESLGGASRELWVARRRPVPPHLLNSRVPRVLSRVVMRLLAPLPHQRYSSGHVLCAELERALEAHADWAAPLYPPLAPAPPREAASPGGVLEEEDAQEQLRRLLRQHEEGSGAKWLESVIRRRDELLPLQPRVWRVSRRQVAGASMLAAVVVTWLLWGKLSANYSASHPVKEPATALPPAAPDTSTPICPSPELAPWEQRPMGADSPPPTVVSTDTIAWKEDTSMKTTSAMALRNSLITLSAVATATCSSVPVRPWPKSCSRAAIAAMDKLKIPYDEHFEISLVAEMHVTDNYLTVRAGPIVSQIRPSEQDSIVFPEGTRLFGYVLPSPGEDVFVRYDELQMPGSDERVPICAVSESVYKPPEQDPERFEVRNRGFVNFVLKFAE